MTDVRGFARHLANTNPETEVPPAGILPPLKRAKPYLYSDVEINALVTAALALPSANGLRRWTYHYLFRSIAATGLRLSEAIGLHRSAVDLDEGVLTVRESKFGKSRLVPLHPTTCAALRSYAERRDAHLGSHCGMHFFVAERGGRLLHQYVHRVFWRLSREIGLRVRTITRGPGFTTSAIASPSRRFSAGIAKGPTSSSVSQCFLPTSVTPACDTYWYLSACPELMEEAAGRLTSGGRSGHEAEPQCRPLVERYFTEGSCGRRNVSANTIASYRDTFRLLFRFAQARLRKLPSPSSSTISMPLSSAHSSPISRQSEASVPGRAICA
ncbi:tyrosine-type recombinase/integrase [Mesorhizobium sp. M0045]|uniref:tyrosine-type recombinase/integrase n=1 Tax=Mesorhizobium sp. M0045 TaxID=2956857 RepID=UPI0033382224